jgi:hypothetical protein
VVHAKGDAGAAQLLRLLFQSLTRAHAEIVSCDDRASRQLAGFDQSAQIVAVRVVVCVVEVWSLVPQMLKWEKQYGRRALSNLARPFTSFRLVDELETLLNRDDHYPKALLALIIGFD